MSQNPNATRRSRSARRRTIAVRCLAALLVLLAGPGIVLAQLSSSTKGTSQDGLTVKAEWLPVSHPAGGYSPMYLELTSTRGPRELRAVLSKRLGSLGSEVGQLIRVEANQPVRVPLSAPLIQEYFYSELRLYERGAELDKLRLSGIDTISSWGTAEPPCVVLIGRVMPDWRWLEQAVGNLFSVTPGRGIWHMLLPPDKAPTRWIDYTTIDLVLVSVTELEQLPAPAREALLAWTMTGGNLVVYSVSTERDRATLDRLLDLPQRAPAGADWRLPRPEDRGVARANPGGGSESNSALWPAEALDRLEREGPTVYREYCTDLLKRVGPTLKSAADLNNLAWACALAPDAVSDPAAVVKLAEQAVTAGQRQHHYLNTLGAALYRAGRFREAVDLLDESMMGQGQGGLPEDWFFLAMAQHRLGKPAEAKQWLDKAVNAPGGPKAEWTLFRQEAEALLEGKPVKPQVKNNEPRGRDDKAPPFAVRALGMGQLARMSRLDPFPGTAEDWTWLFRTLRTGRLKWSERHGIDPRRGDAHFWNFLTEGAGRAPIGAFQVLITIFTLVIGPLNYFLLRRRKRLYLLVVTVPLLALLTTVLLLGYVVGSEGVAVRTRVRSLTLLDQVRGEAVSWSRVSYYAGVAPGDGLRFSTDTAVYPIDPVDTMRPYRVVDWGEDQHLSTGWLRSRVPAQLLVIAHRPAGEQLGVATDGAGNVRVSNNLGATIRSLVLADDKGSFSTAENLPSGGRATLTRMEPAEAGQAVRELIRAQRLLPPEDLPAGQPAQMSFSLFGPLARSTNRTADFATSLLEEALRRLATPDGTQVPGFTTFLKPRTYVAIVERSPLVEVGIRDAVDAGSLYVVWGRY